MANQHAIGKDYFLTILNTNQRVIKLQEQIPGVLVVFLTLIIYHLPTEIKLVLASGTVCGSNRYFRTNNAMEGRTIGRTNLSKNGFSEALILLEPR